MAHMAPTEVMMLGNLQPQLRAGFLNPPRTTPSFPQNLMRQTLLGGLGATQRILQLGQAPVNPNQLAVHVARGVYANMNMNRPFPGQSVPTPPAAFGTPLMQSSDVVGPGLSGFMDYNDDTYNLARAGYVGLSLLSAAVSAIHGYKRDGTAIATWGWFTLGSLFPIITPVVAVSQGFGKRRGRR